MKESERKLPGEALAGVVFLENYYEMPSWERIQHRNEVAARLGLLHVLNALDYKDFGDGVLRLYCTDVGANALSWLHRVTVSDPVEESREGQYVFRVTATLPSGESFTARGITDKRRPGDPVENDLQGPYSAGRAINWAITAAERKAVLGVLNIKRFDPTHREQPPQLAVTAEEVVASITGPVDANECERLRSVARSMGWREKELQAHLKRSFNESALSALTRQQAQRLEKDLTDLSILEELRRTNTSLRGGQYSSPRP